MSRRILVFYAGQLLIEFDTDNEFNTWRRSVAIGNSEFYNGSYVYGAFRSPNHDREWYYMDSTPLLLVDIPKELRAFALLLT